MGADIHALELNDTPVIGLAAHPRLRNGPRSPLIRLFREFEPFLVGYLRPHIFAVDGTARSLLFNGLLHGYDRMISLRPGSLGGFVELAERVVLEEGAPGAVSHVIYLIDPLDQTSLFPETLAIKRECVVKHKFFASTFGAAHEWLSLQWMTSGLPEAQAASDRYYCSNPANVPTGSVALIAHDTKKSDMLDFAAENFELLNTFDSRLSTGTTGRLLNGEEPSRLQNEWAELEAKAALFKNAGINSPDVEQSLAQVHALKERLNRWTAILEAHDLKGEWVTALQTGREGGDVQVAAEIVSGSCNRIFFFEDPLVSREHETDIQVFERSARIPEIVTACYHDLKTANDWARLRGSAGWSKRSIVRAFQDEFQVDCVLAPAVAGSKTPWKSVVERAGWHVFSEINHRARNGQGRGLTVGVGASSGNSVRQVVEAVERVAENSERKGNDRTGIPNNVLVLPTVGLMGYTMPRLEANANASDLAKVFSAESRRVSYSAFVDTGAWNEKHPEAPNELLADWTSDWDDLGVVIFTCCEVTETPGGDGADGVKFPTGLVPSIQAQIGVAEVGGIFLRATGDEVHPPNFKRFGMTHEAMRKAARSGGSILVSGADPRRVAPAAAALDAGIVSVIITDVEFARLLLDSQAPALSGSV